MNDSYAEWLVKRKEPAYNYLIKAFLIFLCVIGLIAALLLPLGSLFYVLFCVSRSGWGWDNFLAEADTGKGIRFPRWSKLWLKFGIPALILVIFVMGYVPKFAVWLGMA